MAKAGSPLRLVVCLLLCAANPPAARAGQPTEGVTRPAAEGRIKPPFIIGVAIDEVGLTPGDLQKARELVTALVDALPPGTEMMVAAFSGEKRIVLPPTSDRAALEAALSEFKPGATGVALPDGLFDIVDYLGPREADARAILLFSAGRPRDGDLLFEDPLNAASSKGLRIFAIGIGQGDGKALRRVAKLTGGDYIRLEVADAAMLANTLNMPAGPSSEAAVKAEAPSPEPVPAPKASGGLLGAAAIFFSLGGLLMLGIVVLLIRKMSAQPAAATPAKAQAKAPDIPLASKKPDQPASLELDDIALEKTLVINADPTLRALSGPGAGKNFPLSPTGHTSIGRSRRNDIVVPEDAASAQHCRIDREGDSYVIHDLGATNGTWLNSAKVQRGVLQHGDRLKIGETVFMVSLFGDRS